MHLVKEFAAADAELIGRRGAAGRASRMPCQHLSPLLFVRAGTSAPRRARIGWNPSGDGIALTASRSSQTQQAEELEAEVLVLSTRGRRGLGELMEGSVATYCIKNCPRPVLLCR